MRFHVPGIPHTVTNKTYLSCAYTQKVYKLCAMLKALGHQVFHYGCEGSTADCTENIDIIDAAYRRRFYPDGFQDRQFRYDTGDELHRTFHERCARAINERREPRDFLLCAWGWGHQPIVPGIVDPITVVESGVGYPDVFAPYRVFESYAWMMHVYGRLKIENGRWYDCVIPNFFDPADFEYRERKEEWFLYLGRLVKRKGVEVAVQVTRELGVPLVIAGQGRPDGPEEGLALDEPHVTFAGFADVAKRRELLAGARAVFMPTYYLEPFGGVSIEAAFSGTPVISTDWGVFAENVLHGVTGYRCRTFEQFLWAAQNVDQIRPADCRAWATGNFTMDRLMHMYDEYFQMLHDLWSRGWYEGRRRVQLDWLRRAYPARATSPARSTVACWADPTDACRVGLEAASPSLAAETRITFFDPGGGWKPSELLASDLVFIPAWRELPRFLAEYPQVPPRRIVVSMEALPDLTPAGLDLLHGFSRIAVLSPEAFAVLGNEHGLRNLSLVTPDEAAAWPAFFEAAAVASRRVAPDFLAVALEERPQAERLAGWLRATLPDAPRVLHVGCGPGVYVRAMGRAGLEACGVDDDPRVPCAGPLRRVDDLTQAGDGPFDLALCLETASRLPPERALDFVSALTAVAPRLLFSAAQPGQGGAYHLNPQPPAYWIEALKARGFELDEPLTRDLRAFLGEGYSLGWLRANVLLFDGRRSRRA